MIGWDKRLAFGAERSRLSRLAYAFILTSIVCGSSRRDIRLNQSLPMACEPHIPDHCMTNNEHKLGITSLQSSREERPWAAQVFAASGRHTVPAGMTGS